MKIGILTFHKSINYGSVLQAFALVRTVQAMGHTVEIIDYEPQDYHDIYRLYHKRLSPRNILSNLLRRFPARKAFQNQQQGFRSFAKKHLPISAEKYVWNSDFSHLGNQYDVILCGGDQIWNVHAKDCDDIYFLPNVSNCKKIAYGISVNDTDFTESKCTDMLRQWILDFDAISLRESDSCKKMATFLASDTEIPTAMDPAFLLSKADYQNLAPGRPVQEPYIFLFSVTFSEDTVRAATVFSQKTGLPVYAMLSNSKSYKFLRKHSPIRILPDRLSPEDFLRFLNHAEFVVSNSFHGTAFSILFEKELFVINDCKGDGTFKNDRRLSHILHDLDLDDRFISADRITAWESIPEINYAEVNRRKDASVARSIKFLENALNSEEIS